MSALLIALATAAATPATAGARPATASAPTTAPAAATQGAKADPMQAFAGMMKVIDKFFPAGPEPEPARLAAAREMSLTIFPRGTYGQAMAKFADSTAERVLDMSEADFAAMAPQGKPAKGKAARPPSSEPLRLKLSRDDPMFDAKKAALKAFVGTMLVKVGDIAEPRFREGMARSLARKFDAAQLAEVRAFLATPTGAAYGRELVGLWFQPDVIRATFEAMPDMMKLAPDLMKNGAAFEAQMKGIAKPDATKN
ncbi:hypothetical protein [Sphingomonas humi]|uniref:DUF2059 domain-containing protein n=1 Tax=Sphingomonas humi TaxID=335630 RepID=A0ABP7RSM3_9SPHN